MMGVPKPEMDAVESQAAAGLLSSLKSIAAAERRRHATVLNYWLSIRKDRAFPPIRDLDPLEISDAGPCSVLLEMIGGGEDAEIRHIGQAIKPAGKFDKISEVPAPSLMACIANKLPIIAATREAFAFEEDFDGENGPSTCWVTLLPFSATGTWIDFVYGFVTLKSAAGEAVAEETLEVEAETEEVVEAVSEETLEPAQDAEPFDEAVEAEASVADPEPEAELPETAVVPEPEPEAEALGAEPAPEPEPETLEAEPASESEPEPEPEPETMVSEPEPEPAYDPEPAPAPAPKRPGFSKIFESLVGGGFYGTHAQVEPTYAEDALPAEQPSEPEPVIDEAPALEEPVAEPEQDHVEEAHAEPAAAEESASGQQFAGADDCQVEGPLQTKLTEVRAKADEARMAKLRSNLALYEGLGAAYDFALDAEENAEEYLKLVEAQGLKIQLRSPMAPVVKLAFDGLCDEATIKQLEAVLAWALKQDLPRGSLAETIEQAGGIAPILSGEYKKAA